MQNNISKLVSVLLFFISSIKKQFIQILEFRNKNFVLFESLLRSPKINRQQKHARDVTEKMLGELQS